MASLQRLRIKKRRRGGKKRKEDEGGRGRKKRKHSDSLGVSECNCINNFLTRDVSFNGKFTVSYSSQFSTLGKEKYIHLERNRNSNLLTKFLHSYKAITCTSSAMHLHGIHLSNCMERIESLTTLIKAITQL